MDYNVINTSSSLEKYVSTGDIVLMQGTGASSMIIRMFTRSPWSHVGMIVKEKNIAKGRAMLWECTRHSAHHNIISRTLSLNLPIVGEGSYLTEDGEVYHYKEGGISLCPLDKQLQKYNGAIIALRKLEAPISARNEWAKNMKPIIQSFIGGFELVSHSLAISSKSSTFPTMDYTNCHTTNPEEIKMPNFNDLGDPRPGYSTKHIQSSLEDKPIGSSSQAIYDSNLVDLCMSQRGCLFLPDTTVNDDVAHGFNGGGGIRRSYFCSSLVAATWFKMGIFNPECAKLPVEYAPCDFSESGHLALHAGFGLEHKTQYLKFV